MTKFCSKSGVFCWSPDGQGLLLATDSTFDYIPSTSIQQKQQHSAIPPSFSQPTQQNQGFHQIFWAQNGVIGGATLPGHVAFYAQNQQGYFEKRHENSQISGVSLISGSATGKWFISGGSQGDVLLWDAILGVPYSPGTRENRNSIKDLRFARDSDAIFASFSENSLEFWDLRQHGRPVFALNSIQNSTSFCWARNSENEVFLGFDEGIVRKFDSRMLSQAIFEFRGNEGAVESIDVNSSNQIISSSKSETLLWTLENPEIFELKNQSSMSNLKWNPKIANLFAFSSSKNQVGFGEIADFTAKKSTQNLNSASKLPSKVIEDIKTFAENSKRLKTFADFLMEKAENEGEELRQLVWLFLAAKIEGSSRRRFLRYLKLMDEAEMNAQIFEERDSRNSTPESFENEFGAKLSFLDRDGLDWKNLDSSDWLLVTNAICGNHEIIINSLISEKKWMLATIYASAHDKSQVSRIFEKFLAAENTAEKTAQIIDRFCVEWESAEFGAQRGLFATKIEDFVRGFPVEKWRYMLGILIVRIEDLKDLEDAMRIVANVWKEHKNPLQALIPLIIAGDLNEFISTNLDFFPEIDKFHQIEALKIANPPKNLAQYEEALMSYARILQENEMHDILWEILKENRTQNPALVEMRENLRNKFGGKISTPQFPGFDPHRKSVDEQENEVKSVKNAPILSGWNDPPPNLTNPPTSNSARSGINRTGTSRYPQQQQQQQGYNYTPNMSNPAYNGANMSNTGYNPNMSNPGFPPGASNPTYSNMSNPGYNPNLSYTPNMSNPPANMSNAAPPPQYYGNYAGY